MCIIACYSFKSSWPHNSSMEFKCVGQFYQNPTVQWLKWLQYHTWSQCLKINVYMLCQCSTEKLIPFWQLRIIHQSFWTAWALGWKDEGKIEIHQIKVAKKYSHLDTISGHIENFPGCSACCSHESNLLLCFNFSGVRWVWHCTSVSIRWTCNVQRNMASRRNFIQFCKCFLCIVCWQISVIV